MANSSNSSSSSHCYCGTTSVKADMLKCQKCEHLFHLDCLKTGSPTSLAGDIFYHLMCEQCAEDGNEDVERMELQWLQVVMLSLYNLQLNSSGKRGFFRWKEHICSFIETHWFTFFGPARKKTTTWYGTVAGILSSNRPTYFKSGAAELGENGWWTLAENKPPSMDTFRYQKHVSRTDKKEVMQVEGLRRRHSKTTLEAAMELKAKRSTMLDAKEIRRSKKMRMSYDKSDNKSDGSLSNNSDLLHVKDFSSRLDMTSPVSLGLSREISSETEVSCMSADPSEVETESSLDDSHRISEISGDSSFINSSILSKSSLMEVDLIDQDSQMSVASSNSALWLTERDLVVGDQVPQCLMMEDDGDDASDLDIDICAITPPASPTDHSANTASSDGLPRMAELLSSLSSSTPPEEPSKVQVKQEISEETYNNQMEHLSSDMPETVTDNKSNNVEPATTESESRTGSTSDTAQTSTEKQTVDKLESSGQQGTKEGLLQLDTPVIQEPVAKDNVDKLPPKIYSPLSLYEERQLLKHLNEMESVVLSIPEANRLHRKLKLRQLKRERGMPLFDLDSEAKRLVKGISSARKTQESYQHLNKDDVPTVKSSLSDKRVLDRYQLSRVPSVYLNQPVSFLNRLVGTDDHQLQCIRSPYTARMLKPFIRRDYETRPRKMLLLEEIRAYPHRNDPTWKAPASPPIDYCYVRPQHIPTINALCREFFWPGIDLSECLQYPDFSCVVLYRKFIIGFAFMVPDVKYNEAYISFIFTHPEWRGAGIASFMLYHLIQTCMGKDVTLHVSASNPAMLMYQRFGFKPEHLILDFYDKYYSEDSMESKHAFFIRLRR